MWGWRILPGIRKKHENDEGKRENEHSKATQSLPISAKEISFKDPIALQQIEGM